MRKSFILYTSMYAPIKHLNEKQLGELFRALFDYQIDGREPATCSPIYIPFLFFKGQFVEDEKKYQERCEKNKANADKRWGTGQAINPIVYAGVPSHTMGADNDNDNVNDNDNDTIEWGKLISIFNSTFGKASRVFPDALKRKYKARLKEGFTKAEIVLAMTNAKSDPYHIESNYKYCTLEFFSRADKLDKFINQSVKQQSKKYVPTK